MAFSSFPAIYLDHPNLQQFLQQQQQPQLVHHHGSTGGVQSSQIHMVDDGLTPPGGGSSIRPGSMVDKARLAKLPAPEAGVKCPRCDSSNTKFCYYNNYNLLQPRHFCKTCRRYWTRGGALRNVPVGGGCRRNKKTKTSGSKQTTKSANSSGTTPPPCPSNSNTDISMSMSSGFPQSGTHLPLMAALHNLNHYAVGPNFDGFPANMGFSLGRNYGGDQNDLSAAGMEPWRLSTPIGGYEQLSNNLFHFQGEGIETASPVIGDQHLGSLTTTQADVKPEESPAENLRKQFHMINPDNNGQFWSGNPWTGFSGNSSSTSHLL